MNSKRRRKKTMADESNRDYEIGYGKPPKHSQFGKGHSGNPHGRPKGSINLSTLLDSTLNEKVIVSENGKRKRITKREAILKQLVNKAASGDPKSIHMLLTEIRLAEGRQPSAEPMLLDETDREVIRQLYQRLHESGENQNEEEVNCNEEKDK
jgi:Family of unknown function (DUF5681)